MGSNRGSLPPKEKKIYQKKAHSLTGPQRLNENSPAGEGVLLRMPDDSFEGGLLSWEIDRRGARPLLVAEPLVWAGDGLGLSNSKNHYTGLHE